MDYREYVFELRKAADYYEEKHPELSDVVSTYRKSAQAIEDLLGYCIAAMKVFGFNKV